LIREILKLARARGWEAVFVVGAPEYYSRFGFCADFAKAFASPYAGPNFMALELVEEVLQSKSGDVAYAPAFAAV
jgi:putative acetyltransferase